ncbi:MAG TPA: DegT/DnrJ/EryC1/StrS family aminotransferase [Gaiellaceae bacterium]|nr:DegT/DnrJ/EryC1/StrS family aminotransferase [Gaiellaceae bacterium]
MTVSVDARSRARVPFLDLGPVHGDLREAVLAGLGAVIDSGAFVNGPPVHEFERAFADYTGAAKCVGVASGLDALRLGLVAAGLEAGDRVLVPANTFVATFEAVTQAGGVPVPVDVSERDYNMDVEATAAALTGEARLLLPVHLYGQLADMVALEALARRAGAAILEDACQAHGATRDGVRPGLADLGAAFSFYPGKNLGAMGDAGAFVTNDGRLAARLRALREHGQARKHVHEVPGWTARLDTFQALVLSLKLPYLEGWNAERRAAAAFYLEALGGVGDLGLPPVAEGSDPVWHVFAVRTDDADGLVASLAARGVQTGRHYPIPPHLSPAYAHLGYPAGSFPVAEALARELVSLPLFPGITEEQLVTVTDAVAAHFDG